MLLRTIGLLFGDIASTVFGVHGMRSDQICAFGSILPSFAADQQRNLPCEDAHTREFGMSIHNSFEDIVPPTVDNPSPPVGNLRLPPPCTEETFSATIF